MDNSNPDASENSLERRLNEEQSGRRPRSDNRKRASIFWTNELDNQPKKSQVAKNLAGKPRLRPLSLRKNRQHIKLDWGGNHVAAIGQTCGKIEPKPCTRCVKMKGPFPQCVTVAGYFLGACCNCHSSSLGPKCSFRNPNVAGEHPTAIIAEESEKGNTSLGKSKPETPKNPQLRKIAVKSSQQYTSKEAETQQTAKSPELIDLTSELDGSPHQPSQDRAPASLTLLEEPRYHTEKNQQEEIQNQLLKEQNQQLRIQNQQLHKEIRALTTQNTRLINLITQQHLTSLKAIKNIVASNSIIEAAIDSREAQMRVGLSNLRGNEAQIQKQATKLLDFSNNTTFLVSRLVLGAMMQHQDLISDDEAKMLERVFNDAEPTKELAAVIEEKLEVVPYSSDPGDNVVDEHQNSIRDNGHRVLEMASDGAVPKQDLAAVMAELSDLVAENAYHGNGVVEEDRVSIVDEGVQVLEMMSENAEPDEEVEAGIHQHEELAGEQSDGSEDMVMDD